MVMVSLNKQENKGRILLIVISLILLPLIFGGVYYVNRLRPQAQEACVPITNPQAVRVSNVSAEITFQTPTAVKASMQCSIQRNGVKFFAGEDAEETTQHLINTEDFNVNLNANTGYYCYIYTCPDNPTEIYIPASALIGTFGLDSGAYSDEIYGSCVGDEVYDPALDINQDGCVLLNDLNEFPEFE